MKYPQQIDEHILFSENIFLYKEWVSYTGQLTKLVMVNAYVRFFLEKPACDELSDEVCVFQLETSW